ncbi:MAG: hypothetical protein H6624_11565 [Bdellovibrionaceae bacterium]|nr:hypothetical protein [Bdellovibrionales bacterium]MCB9084977.1 hypothetical protein [Pseudobdellovibrionaceae bacterium]
MGHLKQQQPKTIWLSLLVTGLMALGLLHTSVYADEEVTAASADSVQKEGVSELPSLSTGEQVIEFKPENDPNMIDNEGDGPDTNTAIPLPTDLEQILSVQKRVDELLYYGSQPARLPTSETAPKAAR